MINQNALTGAPTLAVFIELVRKLYPDTLTSSAP
jgi:hypothetical protein